MEGGWGGKNYIPINHFKPIKISTAVKEAKKSFSHVVFLNFKFYAPLLFFSVLKKLRKIKFPVEYIFINTNMNHIIDATLGK